MPLQMWKASTISIKNYKTISIVGLVKHLTNHLMLALKLIFIFFAKTFTTSTMYVVFKHEIKAMISNIDLVSLIQSKVSFTCAHHFS
jgi:hypothetical protein